MDQEEIKQRQEEILNDSLVRLDKLLIEAENLKLYNQLDKWIIHHCLLNEIPLLQKLLTLCEYDDTGSVIARVRKIAENLRPISHLECFK